MPAGHGGTATLLDTATASSRSARTGSPQMPACAAARVHDGNSGSNRSESSEPGTCSMSSTAKNPVLTTAECPPGQTASGRQVATAQITTTFSAITRMDHAG